MFLLEVNGRGTARVWLDEEVGWGAIAEGVEIDGKCRGGGELAGSGVASTSCGFTGSLYSPGNV